MSELLNNEDKNALVGFIDLALSASDFLPIVSSAKGVYDAYKKFQTDVFNDKLQIFFEGVGNTSKEDIEEFVKLLDNDATEFVKRLIHILDKVEDSEKALFIGRLFKATTNQKVTISEFKRLTSIILTTYIDILKSLTKYSELAYNTYAKVKTGNGLNGLDTIHDDGLINDTSEQKVLVSVGLLVEDVKLESAQKFGISPVTQTVSFFVTPLARKFIEFGLKS